MSLYDLCPDVVENMQHALIVSFCCLLLVLGEKLVCNRDDTKLFAGHGGFIVYRGGREKA